MGRVVDDCIGTIMKSFVEPVSIKCYRRQPGLNCHEGTEVGVMVGAEGLTDGAEVGRRVVGMTVGAEGTPSEECGRGCRCAQVSVNREASNGEESWVSIW